MRTKKNRRNRGESPYRARLWDITGPALFKIKFDTSKKNISCFISDNNPYTSLARKKSHSFSQAKKSSSKNRCSNQKNDKTDSKGSLPKKRDPSPDIILECSNTILSKIEQKGINYTWCDAEEPLEGNDYANDQSIWLAFNDAHDKSFASTNDLPHYHTVSSGRERASYLG